MSASPISPPRTVDDVDLTPLHEYRHVCAQLLCGIVARHPQSIAMANELRDRLEAITDRLIELPDVNEDDVWQVVYEAAGADAMGLALDIVNRDSVPIPACEILMPNVEVTW